MTDKICTRCGQLNQARSNYCSACGAQDFVDASAEQMSSASQGTEGITGSNALLLSVPRVIALSVVTNGVYLLYWLYLTWKQLQGETRDIHFPIWHALTFLVPIYGLFRIHKHVAVIQSLALRAGVEVSITPGLAVIMITLNFMLVITSGGVQGMGVFLILSLIRLALVTTVIVWAQVTLNRYWTSIKGEALENVPIGSGEVRFVLLVLLIQVSTTLWIG